jgi:hypothetical protein
MSIEVDSDTAVRRRAIDDLMDCYVAWREACYAVDLAYQRWADASADECGAFYAAYVAALDREERGSLTYADHIARFRPAAASSSPTCRFTRTAVGRPRGRWPRST